MVPGLAPARSYRDRRLELGDMLRAALHLAHSCGDAGAENQARDLLARLAGDRFRLAVMGQFSRGKSTLMNALLGGAYLPMGALPMTSVITTVRYGTRPKAMIRRQQAALPVEVPLGQVAEFVAASSVRRAETRVATVEVEIPAEILRLGFEFIDTPGVGSALIASTAATRRFLPQADAVIFVTGFNIRAVPGAVDEQHAVVPERDDRTAHVDVGRILHGCLLLFRASSNALVLANQAGGCQAGGCQAKPASREQPARHHVRRPVHAQADPARAYRGRAERHGRVRGDAADADGASGGADREDRQGGVLRREAESFRLNQPRLSGRPLPGDRPR
jgi:Dynamin family